MRLLTTALICLAGCTHLHVHGETAEKQIRITERVFEVDRISLVGERHEGAENVIDVRDLLASETPVTLGRATRIQVGESVYPLTEAIDRRSGRSDLQTWGSVSLRSKLGKQNQGTTHGIGTEICFLDISALNGLLPMVGIYRVEGSAKKRMEGHPTKLLHAMIRMLPIEVRYPKKGEVVEEFAFPISTVAKIVTEDESMRGFLGGEQDSDQQDPQWVDVGMHGLEFSFEYSSQRDGTIRMSRYRYLLSQIIEREELPGLALDAGKPTIVVDGDTVDLEFSTDQLVAIHLTSQQERDGGNPLLLVLTSEIVDTDR